MASAAPDGTGRRRRTMRGTAWKRIERRVLSLITSQDGQERETQERMLLRRAGRSVGRLVAVWRARGWFAG